MLKPNGLIAALGVLAIMGGLVWWSNKHPKTDAAPKESPKLLAIAADQVQSVQIVKTGADTLTLKKTGDTWAITEPSALPADQDAANALAGGFQLFSDRLIDDHPANLADFGLNTPSGSIAITTKDGHSYKLLLGSDAPAGSTTYAKLESDPKVYTVASTSKDSLLKSVNDLRDRRLLPFNQDKLTAVSLTGKGPEMEFGKNSAGEWQIVKPKPYRADSSLVDDLVRNLKDAKMDLSEDAKKAATDFAAATRVGVASVTDNSGTVTVEVRKDKDTFYAKSSVGTYKLTGDLGKSIDKSLDDFRNKKLFDFGFTDPSKIEIAGKAYQKTGDKWFLGSAQIDSASIQNVIDKLRDLAAAKLGDRVAGTPALALSVTYGDKSTVEKTTIDKSGNDYIAQRDGDTTAYTIDSKVFDDLQKAVSDIKPYQAPKDDNKKK